MKTKFLLVIMGLALLATSCMNDVVGGDLEDGASASKPKKILPETRGVAVTPSTVSLYTAETFAFTARLSGNGEGTSEDDGSAPNDAVDNGDDTTPEDVGYKWSITKKGSNNTLITADGILTVGENEAPGAVIVVKAESASNGELWGTAVITVKAGTMPKPIVAFTVNFDLNGGTSAPITPVQVSEGDSVASILGDTWVDPVNISDAGPGNSYYLAAWNTEANGTGTDWAITDLVTRNMTVYAIWRVLEASRSALSFDTMGYTVDVAPATLLVLTNDSVRGSGLELPELTNPRFDFKGWNLDRNLSTPFTADTIVTTRLQTVYAKWEEKEFVVDFNTHGANEEIQSRSVVIGSALLNLAKPTRDASIFGGWYKNYNEMTGIYSNEWKENTDKVTSDITLHAKWIDIITYTVTFNSKGGLPETQTRGVDEGHPVYLPQPAPTKEGFTFGTWVDSEGSEWDFNAPVTSTMTLYATWLELNSDVRTVKFETGEGASEIPDRSTKDGTIITAPADPEKPSSEFIGWYKEAALQNAWDFAKDKVTANPTILYAKWRPIVTYTVSFDTKGATSEAIQSYIVESGHTISAPAVPRKDKATFAGWYYKDGSLIKDWDFDNDTVTKSIQLFAEWTHTITFVSNLGSSVAPITGVSTNSKIIKPSDPTRGGATFVGWYKESRLTNAWDWAKDTVTEDITLYALWQHVVTFKSNGGTPNEFSKTVYTGKKIDKPNVTTEQPVKGTAEFDVWCKDEGLLNVFNFNEEIITTDTTIYARWIQTNTVKFNTNGASSATPVSVLVTTGQTIAEPKPQPTKRDSDFGGWYSDSALTSAWDFTTAVSGDMTLYVKWTHDVIFDPHNKGATTTVKVVDGRAAPVPTPEPKLSGYKFTGWYADELNTVPSWDFLTAITAPLTLHAKWSEVEYEVKFFTDGGDSVPTQNVKYNSRATRPATNPGKTGADFIGWYHEAVFKTTYQFTEPVTADITVYAKFESKSYEVKFDVDEGSAVDKQRVTHGLKVSEPESPTKTGAGFAGWYHAGKTEPWNFESDVITGPTTIYAKWRDNEYKVEFVTDGGTEIAPVYVAHGKLVAVPDAPIKNGHTFVDWYKSAEDTAKKWAFNTETITKDTKIYARYEASNYTVTFYKNDGTNNVVSTKTAKYDTFVVKPNPNPTRSDFDFDGWYRESSCETEFDTTKEKITSNLPLYAKWIGKLSEITWNTDGGTLVSGLTAAQNGRQITMGLATKAGFTFEGWYIGAQKYTSYTMGSSAVTFKAYWKLNGATVSPDGTATYLSNQAITLTNANADRIYYTTDGNDPTTESDYVLSGRAIPPATVAASIINGKDGNTLKTMSVRSGAADSDVVSTVFKQTQCPAPTIEADVTDKYPITFKPIAASSSDTIYIANHKYAHSIPDPTFRTGADIGLTTTSNGYYQIPFLGNAGLKLQAKATRANYAPSEIATLQVNQPPLPYTTKDIGRKWYGEDSSYDFWVTVTIANGFPQWTDKEWMVCQDLDDQVVFTWVWHTIKGPIDRLEIADVLSADKKTIVSPVWHTPRGNGNFYSECYLKYPGYAPLLFQRGNL